MKKKLRNGCSFVSDKELRWYGHLNERKRNGNLKICPIGHHREEEEEEEGGGRGDEEKKRKKGIEIKYI
jgi:hypothetical protein